MSTMVCSTIAELRTRRAQLAGTVGFVPTMGALHEGHRSLLRIARERCQHVIASVFVNPTQFGPNEDFARYPRTWDKDLRILEADGVDLVFAPAVEEMYRASTTTTVDPGPIGTRLDGASRPGHFDGVATVVTKLLNITQPHIAFFGQKDAAQCAVLQSVVRDLNLPVTIAICPTVREPDGLALSSRNAFLSAEQRQHALALFRALHETQQLFRSGVTASSALQHTLKQVLTHDEGLTLDYAEIVSPTTLLRVDIAEPGDLAAVAAWIGPTRLIDNVVL